VPRLPWTSSRSPKGAPSSELRDGEIVTLRGTARVHATTAAAPLTDTPCLAWSLRIHHLDTFPLGRAPLATHLVTEHGGVVFQLETKLGDVLVLPPASMPVPPGFITKVEVGWERTIELPIALELVGKPRPIIPRRLARETELLRARGIEMALANVHLDELRVEPGARVEVTGLVSLVADGEPGFRDPERRAQLIAPPDGALRIEAR
jgi:hypothetical protein